MQLTVCAALIATLISALVIFATRLFPFALFSNKEPPALLKFIEKYIPPMIIVEVVCRPHNYHNEEVFIVREKDINSLDHTSWRCQYHIVFAPKYRRMEIYGEIKVDIGKILRQLCQQMSIKEFVDPFTGRENRKA